MNPNPEQVKLEEKVLEANLANISTNIDVAILVCESLGKTNLRNDLEHFKKIFSHYTVSSKFSWRKTRE